MSDFLGELQSAIGKPKPAKKCGTCGKAKNIATGFSKLAIDKLLNRPILEKEQDRLDICNKCNYRTWLTKSRWGVNFVLKTGKQLPINYDKQDGHGLYCSICKCYLEAKVRVEAENCPMNKWENKTATPQTDMIGGLVSAVIPSRNEKYLVRTIEDLLSKSRGEIEVWVILDGWDCELPKDDRIKILKFEKSAGQRVSINEAMRQATGKYMFKCDAHCILSEGWDIELKKACLPQTFLTPRTYSIDEKTWTVGNRAFDFVYLDKDLQVKWWQDYKKRVEHETVSETMAFIGMSWFCLRSYWLELGGYDEKLPNWGETGTEWALKVWLTGGRFLVHKGVWCGHLFREKFPYSVSGGEVNKGKAYIRPLFLNGECPGQIHSIDWLVGKFWPIPTWEKTLYKKEERKYA